MLDEGKDRLQKVWEWSGELRVFSTVLCQNLQGELEPQVLQSSPRRAREHSVEHLALGLVDKEQELDRTQMSQSVFPLAWALGSRAGNGILQLDVVVPGKSP
jgi:hypothetical protein